MNCLNFGSLILASLYNMGWVGVVWMGLPLIYGFHVTEHLSERLIKNVFSIGATRSESMETLLEPNQIVAQ